MMNQKKKLSQLEEMMGMEEGTLKPETVLRNLDEWDSLAKLSLIVLMDDEYGKHLTGEKVREFTTIDDILNCMG